MEQSKSRSRHQKRVNTEPEAPMREWWGKRNFDSPCSRACCLTSLVKVSTEFNRHDHIFRTVLEHRRNLFRLVASISAAYQRHEELFFGMQLGVREKPADMRGDFSQVQGFKFSKVITACGYRVTLPGNSFGNAPLRAE